MVIHSRIVCSKTKPTTTTTTRKPFVTVSRQKKPITDKIVVQIINPPDPYFIPGVYVPPWSGQKRNYYEILYVVS